MCPKILIVDDEQFVRDLLAKVLRRRGHDVTLADDAQGALDALGRETFDVLLTDVVMPGLDGFGLLRRVKSADPSMKVIVLTGYARKQSISDFLLFGADDYLTKPFQVHELVAAVDRVSGAPGRADPARA
jgi:two-component system cell cycle response regulator CpdR